MSNFTTLSQSLVNEIYDPTAIQRKMVEFIDQAGEGEIDLVDPTSPFVMLMEMAGACSHAVGIDNLQTLRKLTPNMALTNQDLYRHMADVDYLDRFATPTTAKLKLIIAKNALVANAVSIEGSTDRKMVLPRYSTFTVDGINFSNLYPITFTIQSNNGIRINYDTQVSSILQPAKTNLVDWRSMRISDIDFIIVDIDVMQITRKAYNETLSAGSSFVRTYSLAQQFYHCEVKGTYSSGETMDFSITHSEEVYNIDVPTVLVQVEDGQVSVEIPLVYINQGNLPSNITIVLYTTQGQLKVDLADYESSAYSYTLSTVSDSVTQSSYINGFLKINDIGISSTQSIDGGSDGLSFEALRQRVIDNSNNINLPITYQQLAAKFNLLGYDVILSVDDIMRRVYLAARTIPNTTDSGFSYPASATMDTLQASYSTLSALQSVSDHGERITIDPTTLYQYIDGKLEVVLSDNRPEVVSNSPEALVSMVNEGNYVYSPFYYVLDASDQIFDVRAYVLDSPSILARQFITKNDIVDVSISTDAISITKVDSGYRLQVSTLSDDNFKSLSTDIIHAQLIFSAQGETGYASITGTLIGTVEGEYVWQFDLTTTLDINNQHHLYLNAVDLPTAQQVAARCLLEQPFEIVYVLSGQSTDASLRSDIDGYVDTNTLPNGTLGITQEQVTIEFGKALTHLWSNGLTVAGQMVYQRHSEDVPYTYDDDVLEYDENGALVINVDEQDNVTYNILHQAGDPVMVDGEVQYRYRQGDVVIGQDGDPVIIATRDTDRRFSLVLVDGVYYHCTTDRDVTYRDAITSGIVERLDNDIDQFISLLHENTELYYYPKKTLGKIEVSTGNGAITTIDAAMDFTIRYTVDEVAYQDFTLRDDLVDITSSIINAALQSNVVSVDAILSKLREATGNDIISVDMDKLGDDKNISMFTVLNNSIGRSVKRELTLLPSGLYSVQEAIDVTFIKHS